MPISTRLEERIFVIITDFVVLVVLVRISKSFDGHLLSLDFFLLILLLGLLRLTFRLSLCLLNLFVLNDIARLDNFRDSIVVQNILALLNDFLQEDCGEMDFSMSLQAFSDLSGVLHVVFHIFHYDFITCRLGLANVHFLHCSEKIIGQGVVGIFYSLSFQCSAFFGRHFGLHFCLCFKDLSSNLQFFLLLFISLLLGLQGGSLLLQISLSGLFSSFFLLDRQVLFLLPVVGRFILLQSEFGVEFVIIDVPFVIVIPVVSHDVSI
mmetsp:Transcript_9860/g.28612  ORF Transcript_9860/g.28612 Transcript_9860/m.28612 type:complete len:265 (-) Transcript_9860:125-919(-)